MQCLSCENIFTVEEREDYENAKHEGDFLMELMCRFGDAYHIVKYYGFTDYGQLVFETLDIDLEEYVVTNMDTLSLDDIRHIIQQMATALDFLKSLGVIHGEVSPKSIIIEDQNTRPVRVKLANFSSARLRAPEICSGQPSSDAADMWSLGRVMLFLLGSCEHYTRFMERMMYPEEDVEMDECIQLLKAMMTQDPEERITPIKVLNHPFILRGSYPWKNQYPEFDEEFRINCLDFEMMQKLGKGAYGELWKCRNSVTGEVVAVKRPLFKGDTDREITILKKLIAEKADQHNIVKCHGWFECTTGKWPVFELLDETVDSFLSDWSEPMLLSDIRVIIQQMAVALRKLKQMGIIHTDIKADNIIMVDQQRPFRIKLIDFGVAVDRSELELGLDIQVATYRAPEVHFGLPLSEAVDMWSLGCVMAEMVMNLYLFEGHEQQVVAQMVEFLGMPPDHLLNKGIYAEYFFTKTKTYEWRLKRRRRAVKPIELHTGDTIRTLDDLKTMRLEENNAAEAVEREQCIELLKAMLAMDPDKRITPQEVLQHPFITNCNITASCNKTFNSHQDHYSPPPTPSPPGVTTEKEEEKEEEEEVEVEEEEKKK
ncbi:homeodomain-interacting protein kinase 3-like, partial [Antennarius striatus]|uniref:homeodomain-interacting protein kinase 3-like n=1 Tax=Antennarius striatus TaxID=241820 RepID=UPI0035ADA363